MNITRRRGAIAFFVTLGICLAGLTLALNVSWVVLNWRRVSLLVVGVFFFSLLMAGVILNTIFLVREIRRNERHDSFLNAVTHELKTPIASIRLYLETLQRRPIDEAQRQQFYSIMLADSDRLLATVEQVLKAGEVGQRKDEHPHVELDLRALAAECVALALQRHHLDDRAIRIEPAVGPPLLVSGNSEELRTVLLNLIDNAVKYSATGVAIRIQLASEKGEWAILRVVDSGMGIPPAHLKRIFKRFYRVPSMGVLKTKGTGLGLFIVRSIVRQHGGEVEAHSDGFGKGATMGVRLPLAGPGSRAGRKESAMKKAASL
ncbi:MAG: sensor histidine kinase [Acidobacteriaceae bacterium]